MRHCDIPVVPLVGYRICTFYARHAKALKQDQKTHNYLQQRLNLSNARVEMATPSERDPTNKKFLWFHWFPTGWWLGLGQPWSSFWIWAFGSWSENQSGFGGIGETVKLCYNLEPSCEIACFFFLEGGRGAALVYEYFLEEMCVPGWLMLN